MYQGVDYWAPIEGLSNLCDVNKFVSVASAEAYMELDQVKKFIGDDIIEIKEIYIYNNRN
jgi:hypothetical protein